MASKRSKALEVLSLGKQGSREARIGAERTPTLSPRSWYTIFEVLDPPVLHEGTKSLVRFRR